MRSLLGNPVIRFFVTAVLLFAFWLLIYEVWLHPKGHLDKWIISQIIYQAGLILQVFGYEIMREFPFDENFRTLGIDGGHSIWVGDPCNGLELFALFAGFIIAYSGKWLNKVIIIPLGVLAIHLLNVIRVAALAAIVYYNPDLLQFNHTYTFTILVYSAVFILWYFWSTKWNHLEFSKKTGIS